MECKYFTPSLGDHFILIQSLSRILLHKAKQDDVADDEFVVEDSDIEEELS